MVEEAEANEARFAGALESPWVLHLGEANEQRAAPLRKPFCTKEAATC